MEKEDAYIYEYYSAVKNNETMSFVVMDGSRDYHMLSEVNQMEKDKCHMSSLTCEI